MLAVPLERLYRYFICDICANWDIFISMYKHY